MLIDISPYYTYELVLAVEDGVDAEAELLVELDGVQVGRGHDGVEVAHVVLVLDKVDQVLADVQVAVFLADTHQL